LSISKHVSRVAAIGAAGAMGAVALVGIAPAADAAVKPLKTSYTCDVSALGQSFDFPAVIKIDTTAAKAKKTIAARKFAMTVTIPEEQATLIRTALGATEISGTASGAKYKVGKTSVALQKLVIKKTAVGDSGPIKLPVNGKSAAFTIKKKGTYAVTAPKKFTFAPVNQDGADLIPGGAMPCSVTSGSSLKAGSMKIK